MYPMRGIFPLKRVIRGGGGTLRSVSPDWELSLTRAIRREMSANTQPPRKTSESGTRDGASSPARLTADNERVVRRLIEEGFNQGNLKVLEEVLDPDFVEHQQLPPGVPPTRAAVGAIIRALRTGFPDFHLAIESIDAVDDRVWLRLRATGTQKGPFMGNRPTGRAMSIDVMDAVRVRRGRITEHWGVPDNGTLLEQLGL